MCIGTNDPDAAYAEDAARDPVTCYIAARAAGILLSATPAGRLLIDAPLLAPAALLEALWGHHHPLGLAMAGKATGHRLAPCDGCGEWTIVARGTKPRCRMTPKCKGHHRGWTVPR